MSEKLPSKDEALEALDFIVNVLKEHEKDLDRLVSELGTVVGQLGESGELSGKVKKIEEKINGLQDNVTSLVNSLSSLSREPAATLAPSVAKEDSKGEIVRPTMTASTPVLLKCSQWEDFQSLASLAQTVSFTFKESEKTLEVNALKNNQVITFNGEMPKLSALLKMFLSRQLALPEKQVLEGQMSLG